jgi:hypothetical protein
MTLTPPPEVKDAVRLLIKRHGTVRTAKALRMSDSTAARIAGGLPVRSGSIALAQERLTKLREWNGDAV